MIAFYETLKQAFPDKAKHAQLRAIMLEAYGLGELAQFATDNIEHALALLLDEPVEALCSDRSAGELDIAIERLEALKPRLKTLAAKLHAIRASWRDHQPPREDTHELRGQPAISTPEASDPEPRPF